MRWFERGIHSLGASSRQTFLKGKVGLERIRPLEQLAQNYKSDAIELPCICEASFDPLIEEKLTRISERMDQMYAEMVGKVEKMSKELELVWTEVTDVADKMELLK